jgi:hypothetical protein
MSANDELGHRVSPACSSCPLRRSDCTNSAPSAARAGTANRPIRWRWVFRVYCVAFATLLVATAVAIAGALAAHPVRVDESGGLAAVDHPVGWFNAGPGTTPSGR